jgi:enamidase
MITLIHDIRTLVSSDIARPPLDADSLVIRDGRIAAVGRGLDADANTVIDARGTIVMPGLIDSDVHSVFVDFKPRQRTLDFLDSALNGGVTTAMSAGRSPSARTTQGSAVSLEHRRDQRGRLTPFSALLPFCAIG